MKCHCEGRVDIEFITSGIVLDTCFGKALQRKARCKACGGIRDILTIKSKKGATENEF